MNLFKNVTAETAEIGVPFNWVDGERLRFDEPSKQEGVISSVELTVHDVSEVHIGPEHDLVFPVYCQT